LTIEATKFERVGRYAKIFEKEKEKKVLYSPLWVTLVIII